MHRLCSALVSLSIAGACGGSSPEGEPDEGLDSSSSAADDSSGTTDAGSSGTESESAADSETDTGDVVEGPIEGRDCLPDNGLTASNFGMPFLLTWCAGCHSAQLDADERGGAPVGIDLDTVAGAKEHLLRTYARSTGDTATMPPAGGPTAEERELLADWLACGAPE